MIHYLIFVMFISMMAVLETEQPYTRHTYRSDEERYDGCEFSSALTMDDREEISCCDIEE